MQSHPTPEDIRQKLEALVLTGETEAGSAGQQPVKGNRVQEALNKMPCRGLPNGGPLYPYSSLPAHALKNP